VGRILFGVHVDGRIRPAVRGVDVPVAVGADGPIWTGPVTGRLSIAVGWK
jgi:hypothetical protein